MWVRMEAQWVGPDGVRFAVHVEAEIQGDVTVEAIRGVFDSFIKQIGLNASLAPTTAMAKEAPTEPRKPLVERIRKLSELLARHPDKASQIMDAVLNALMEEGFAFDPEEAAGEEFWLMLAQSDEETQNRVHRALDRAAVHIRSIIKS